MVKSARLHKTAIEVLLLGACIVLFCSCLSFDVSDPPSEYVWPHNEPVANWCGLLGAFFAYYLMYYVGPGVLVALAASIWALGASLVGKEITQPVLRVVGLTLLVAAFSGTWYLLWPSASFGPYSGGVFPVGAGGALGIAVGNILKSHFAVLGTSIVVTSTWIVGAVLLADVVVLAFFRWFGRSAGRVLGLAVPALSAARQQSQQLGKIWRKLSIRQRRMAAEPAVTEVMDEQLERETSFGQDHYEDAQAEPVQVASQSGAGDKTGQLPKNAAVARPMKAYVPKSYENYTLPTLDLLRAPEHGFAAIQEKMVDRKARALESLLLEFGINANVINSEPGPAITMYELELAPGIKVSQISNLANDMARALGAGSVRVVAPLAGRHTIGIEVPNSQREIVRIKDLIQRAGPKAQRRYIPLFLGKSSSGEVLVPDLAALPHLLIAGTTGSGKSVCINSIITSILMTKRPDEVKLILVDPKMVEMAIFESTPHLMCPIITETKRAEQILEWATTKMDERYELLAEAKVRNIASYNKLGPEEIINRFNPSCPEEEAKIPKMMPHIVIVIDELADLMMTAAKEIEAYIVRLAQKSRAVGIHLVVATQRPQATVVTGLIKSNMPARVGFRVAARMDSRIILDQNGGETLLGQGDMLFLKPGTSDLVRAQGAFVDDTEIKNITRHLKEVAEPQFHPELMQLSRIDVSEMPTDELFDEGVQLVFESRRGSVSLLQRRLSIGYARASRIIEMMAASGILGEYKGSQAREVLMTAEQYEHLKRDMLHEEVAGYADLSKEDEAHEGAEEVEDKDEEEVLVKKVEGYDDERF
jgi:S-DNA-T family DNA segregation ATPase FtsK/SpoIIIE